MTEVVQVGKATEVRTCKLGTIVTHKACWDAMGGEETRQLGDNAGRRRGTQQDDVKKSREVVNYQDVRFTIMLHQITPNGVPWELRVRNRLKWLAVLEAVFTADGKCSNQCVYFFGKAWPPH